METVKPEDLRMRFAENHENKQGYQRYIKRVILLILLLICVSFLVLRYVNQKHVQIQSTIQKAETELELSLKTGIYSKMVKVEGEPIKRKLVLPNDKSGLRKLILGRSKILVNKNDVIGAQVDRVNRDWYGKEIDKLPSETPKKEELITYHEGARIKDILDITDAKLRMLTNTIVRKCNNAWFAPDENGIFKYEVLKDKVLYPTSMVKKNVGLLRDTHGISSIVYQAVHEKATLIVGCGDTPSKMQAAVHLAGLGKNVYFPCDRYVGEIIGYEGSGMLIGTAPVKKGVFGAIIGDQPIEVWLSEKIVVEDTNQSYPIQYYDAPRRYFEELQKISGINFNLIIVKVSELKEGRKIVSVAREEDARVVAIRVAYEEDYLAVKNWLLESNKNRAILFHSAPYEPGYRLFREFPKQTSFGDPKPIFE
ncbi:MAG TPA: hypothetical protein VMW82_01760 [Candidatus Paceibacterota bacterium]|nr:hypothetical protein [Candidatus Paceibacterota bacterium]